jgi:hypothetical protein
MCEHEPDACELVCHGGDGEHTLTCPLNANVSCGYVLTDAGLAALELAELVERFVPRTELPEEPCDDSR